MKPTSSNGRGATLRDSRDRQEDLFLVLNTAFGCFWLLCIAVWIGSVVWIPLAARIFEHSRSDEVRHEVIVRVSPRVVYDETVFFDEPLALEEERPRTFEESKEELSVLPSSANLQSPSPTTWLEDTERQVPSIRELPSVGGPFHGNINSHIFHDASCRWFRCKNCVRAFAFRDQALDAGYRPCRVCRP